jgi:hypothetical protein
MHTSPKSGSRWREECGEAIGRTAFGRCRPRRAGRPNAEFVKGQYRSLGVPDDLDPVIAVARVGGGNLSRLTKSIPKPENGRLLLGAEMSGFYMIPWVRFG